MNKVPITILIPVKNEEANLPRCLDCIRWADEVFIVDSQSTDKSVEIAEAWGAKVFDFKFNGRWPKKRNWALETLPFSHEWIFILDADEVLPPEAEEEFRNIVTNPNNPYNGYWINRRFMFMDKWLKHAYFPNWVLRCFKHKLGRYEQLTDTDAATTDNEVHEPLIVQGELARMNCVLDHYAFPTVEVFVTKHNYYSNWEAAIDCDPKLGLSSTNISRNHQGYFKMKLKQWSRKMPFRPLMRFLYIYIFQKGFLDGREGYYFARLHGIYEFLSVAKAYELRKQQKKK